MTVSTSLPRGIWALGFVSLFMDVSSELIHSLLPTFMVVGLGASLFAVGLVEGVAEATAAASAIAGGLWQWVGPRATFTAGAVFTTIALVWLVADHAGRRVAPGSPQ